MKQLSVILVLLVVLSCNSVDKLEKPDNLISKDKMVDVLYDTFVLNSAKGTSKGILEDNGIFPENYVYEKHNIDSLQFVLSNEYYGFYVEEYETIIARVEDRFKKDKEKFQAKIDREAAEKERKKDSIKKLRDSLNINKTRKIPTAKKKIKKNQSTSSK